MAKFTVVIDLDNAAFDDTPESEVARILRKLTKDIENDGPFADGDVYVLRDVNGNRVGQAMFEEE